MAQMLKYARLMDGCMEQITSESPIYKLEKCLGEGLSSCVYKAERRDSRGHSRQQVVLKILKNKNQVEWLRQEFEALSKIDSSFCVRMLAWENLKLGPALVLEYIEGVTLFEVLQAQTLELDIIDEITAQIQLGLLSLERAGRFHGDLNLKNIMIDKSGGVKLIDFATSLHISSSSQEMIGTPQYLSPEIWSGRPRSIKSDLFSIGLLRIDMKDGVLNIPKTQEECRLRAERVQNSDLQLLNSVPSERNFKKIQRNIFAKKRLGKTVVAILNQKNLQTQQTLQLDLGRPQKRHLQLSVLGVLAVFCFVLPVTSTPLARIDTSRAPKVKNGTLEVRTKEWIEVTIDNKSYGYAPLIIEQFHPGLHRLKWKSLKASGEIKFKFESGELRILTEKDFSEGSKI